MKKIKLLYDATAICSIFEKNVCRGGIFFAAYNLLLEFLKRKELKRDETVMVGDTLHDGEIAQKCHINYLLVADGHQSFQVLSKMGKPLHHIDELLEVIKE